MMLLRLVTGGVIILLLYLLVRILQKIYKKESGKSSKLQLPPYAPTTMMKTIHALTHGQHPWFFLNLQKQMYPIKLFRLPISFTKPWIVIGDVNIALKVDKDIHTKRPTIGYTDIASCIGSGGSIVTLEGQEWKHRRLATNVVFASNNLKSMSSVMKTCTEHWMKTTLGIDETKSFDVGKEMVGLAIKIILESAFDYKATSTEAEYLSSELFICSQEFAKVSGGLNPLRKVLGPLFSSEVRRAKLARENVFNFALKITNVYQENDKDDSKTCTLLSCIMNNPNYKNDNERASDIVMWMNAGFDNTGFAISWVLLDLARHPSIVSVLRDELKVVPQKDWHKCTSIRNICKESMRLHPVTPGGSLRLLGVDFIFDNMIIPKRSIVQLPSYLYTRDEDVFNNPTEFQPNRWNEKNKSQSMTETFIPYTAGRHNCAGQAFANLEIETVVSCLLSRYNFLVDVEGHEEYFITLKPVGARLFASKI